jgi:hypothetical protein
MTAVTSFDSELILARLQGLHPKVIDLSLERIERLLGRLGNPERRLAPVVHIAGTNGKGSTLAMLDAMLEAAGRRVQRYISPHLVRFNERILLEGNAIPELELVEVLDACEQVNDGAPITFFEITTAAAFLAFARHPADVCSWRPGSAAGSMRPTSSSSPASPRSRPSPSITRRSSANAWSRSLSRRPAFSSRACPASPARSRRRRWR